ncbi:MAG: putative bacteriocin export ABC transporter [Eubacterium sp.]|nr:putative bacteriocin export ABC transporter [Eubacterium sp.]
MSVINLENITKSYGHHMIFKDYNLSVEEGEFVAICGESGKGKTTLLNIMGMIEKADKGDLYLFDRKNPDIRKASGRKLLRTEMTYVFQNYGLVEDKTVQYNLNIASHFTDVTEKDIEDVLNKVGLDKSILKNKVYTLSGGEQQRVAIARVFLKKCKLLLADEPTGSLDAGNKEVVMKLFEQLNKEGTTIVMVTHDEEILKYATRIVEL